MAPMKLLSPLACAAFALATTTSTPAVAETWREVFPLQAQKTFTIEAEGVTVTVTPAPPYDDEAEDTGDSFRDSYEDATIEVRFPGLPVFHVPKDEYRSSPYGIRVGIGRLAASDPAPTVLLAGYSGGAHCCATTQLVGLVDGRPVATSLPMKDGEPLDAFPRDIDGDGVRDFEWIDGSLLYAFTSYAGSWPVPRIYNVRQGKLVDVTREPGFARPVREFAQEALAECRKAESENAGPCAAYAYGMALQRRAEEGIRVAVAQAGEPSWWPIDCLVEYDENDLCPEGKEREFANFEEALRWIMRKNGYLP
jgi:hypothetical protein